MSIKRIKIQQQQTVVTKKDFDFGSVVFLSLKNNKQIKDFSFLKEMPNIKRLDLSNTNFSDLSLLVNMKSLTHLYLNGLVVKCKGVLKQMNQLKVLHISKCNGMMPYLKTLTNLQTLNLSGNNSVNFSYLKNLKQLIYLSLHNTQVKNSDIKYLCGLHQLITLDIKDTKIDDIECLGRLKSLNTILNTFKVNSQRFTATSTPIKIQLLVKKGGYKFLYGNLVVNKKTFIDKLKARGFTAKEAHRISNGIIFNNKNPIKQTYQRLKKEHQNKSVEELKAGGISTKESQRIVEEEGLTLIDWWVVSIKTLEWCVHNGYAKLIHVHSEGIDVTQYSMPFLKGHQYVFRKSIPQEALPEFSRGHILQPIIISFSNKYFNITND